MENQPNLYRDWSNLPAESLSLILKSLNDTETDRRRLRSVCPAWRSSLAPQNHPPPLRFPIPVVFPCPDYEDEDTVYLRQSVFYLFSSPTINTTTNTTTSTNFWLTRDLEKSGPPNLWILQNPLSRADEFRPLPQLIAKPLEFRVYILGYSCSLDGDKNYFWEPVTSLGDRVFFVSKYVSFSVKAEEIFWLRGDCLFFTQEGFMGQANYCYYFGIKALLLLLMMKNMAMMLIITTNQSRNYSADFVGFILWKIE